MKTLTALLFCAASSLYAQNFPYIASTGQVSLVSAGTAATLQQPAATCGANGASRCSLPVTFPTSTVGDIPAAGAAVYCSVACVATVSINATTPATATAGTVTAYPGSPVPAVQFFTASNASGGTTLATIPVSAGSWQPLDMSRIKLAAGVAQTSVTISVASITGTANITFYPLEQH